MMRKNRLWNDGWQFLKTKPGVSLEEALSNGNFCDVHIPHDWMISHTEDLYENSIGWYRKRFHLSKSGERYAVRFEGAYMDSTIWINGKQIFEWKYGYSAFEFDITDYVRNGENEIILRAVYQRDNSRWYSGAGIYRDVFFKEMSEQHLVSDGIYVHSSKKGENYEVTIFTEVMQGAGTNLGSLGMPDRDYAVFNGIVKQVILDHGKTVAEAEEEISLNQFTRITQTLSVESPREWDIESPYLYDLHTYLYDAAGNPVDETVQKIGFRTTEYSPKHGFLLNGRKVRLQGACEHHDLGCLGAAVNVNAIERKLKKLRAMGVNAIRTSHNMPAREWLEFADEMGFLINCEAFDMWELPKTTYDYARFFKEWSERDVASWIRRDRNHPSVIFWSIGNEIYDTHKDEHGQEITRCLCRYVAEHDPLMNAPVTIGSNYMPWENAQKCADIVKMAGYNYAEKYYEEHHKEHPDWVIYGSETSSTVQSRGVYKFPLEIPVLCDDDEQCSCLGNCSTSWGSKRPENNIAMDRETEFSCGQFIWTGFDYIGEPTPYSTKNSYFGQLDTAGFPKDTYYIYQAEWTDAKKSPMVHIFPYWDFNDGEIIDVRVCSNGSSISLFFNEELIGTHRIDHRNGTDQVAHFKIPYSKGRLKAIAYDEFGNSIAEDVVSSFGDGVRLQCKPEKGFLHADGKDLAFVEISVCDENETEVSNANNRITAEVSGAGYLVGLDNGDSTDYEQYKTNSRRLFQGKLLLVATAGVEPGEMKIVVKSDGLESCTIQIPVLSCDREEGISVIRESVQKQMIQEIPIRNVSLDILGNRELNQDNRTATVRATLHPANTTYRDVIFKATNESGVESNLVELSGEGLERTVTALGDGIVYVKCMVYNGSDKVKLISQVRFSITGLGTASLNPYEFVSASLYTKSSTELGNGLERGIAMKKNAISWMAFEKVDFGAIGSETLTIPVYELENKPFPIEIWDGIPFVEGSELIEKVIYDIPSIWSKYQEKTYVLPKRLTGVHTLSFVADHDIEIKGFSFKKHEKAYETNSVLLHDALYGDAYEITEDAIVGIGNNVSVTFKDMNFSKGLKRLVICGRTPRDINTIHVRFEDETGTMNQIAEFSFSEEYAEQTFELENVYGVKTVHFVFMPGCLFDFNYFRFEA